MSKAVRIRHTSRTAAVTVAMLIGALWNAAAEAFPIRVDIWLMEYPEQPGYSYQVAAGGFTFDSEYFLPQPSSDPHWYVYSGFVPANELDDAGIDFFSGAYAGTHWDISDVTLSYKEVFPITEGHLGYPQWSWWWTATIGGHAMGGDGSVYWNDLNGNSYSAGWSQGLVPDDRLSLPEPPTIALVLPWIVIGLTVLRRRRSPP